MKKLVGLFASVALMTSGMALAQGQQDDVSGGSMQQSGQVGSGQGGSGTTGSQSGSMGQGGAGATGSQSGSQGQMGQSGQDMGSQMGAQAQMDNSVDGTIVRANRRSIFLQQQDGAVVQLKVSNKTEFKVPGAKKATDLTEGQQVRASFKVDGIDNQALSIEASQGAGTGGGGNEGVLMPDEGINDQGGILQDDTGSVDPGGSLPNDDVGGAGNVDQGGDIGSDINPPSGEKNY